MTLLDAVWLFALFAFAPVAMTLLAFAVATALDRRSR